MSNQQLNFNQLSQQGLNNITIQNPKKIRKSIDLSIKIEIIRLAESGTKQSEIKILYNLSESTVRTILKNKNEIIEVFKNSTEVSQKELNILKLLILQK